MTHGLHLKKTQQVINFEMKNKFSKTLFCEGFHIATQRL